MYIEIADRRSGKTTRLIKKLKEVYEDTKKNRTSGKAPLIVLMCLSKTSVANILSAHDLVEDDCLKAVCTSEELLNQCRGRADREIHLFVDEFTYNLEFKMFLEDEVRLCDAPIICNGYYSSSRCEASGIVGTLLEYAPMG